MPPLLHGQAEARGLRRPGGAVPAPLRRPQADQPQGLRSVAPAPPSAPRRAALLALKLQSLVRDHTGVDDGTPAPFPGGAALSRGDQAWVLVQDDPGRGLGRALAWADARGATELSVVVDAEGGLLARRAALFDPSPAIWSVDGRELRPAVPSSRPVAAAVPNSLASLRGVIAASGAEVVEEHGVLAGEVVGLEVCRAVEGDGEARLEVGIGAHDREAFRLVHAGEPVQAALTELVEQVAAHRRPGAPPHALNRIARERLLRWRLCREPVLIGLQTLIPAPPPVPRPNLKDALPCVAVGTDADGRRVVVVCSAGVDLDAAPFAADARDALGGPEDRLVVAVPEGDDHPVTKSLAARLVRPAEVVAVPPAPSP